MKVILFTRNGGKPPKLPDRSGLEFEHIHFESTKLEHLMIIAKYRIIDFPTSLILDNKGKVILKVKGSIPGNYIDNLLDS